MAQPSFEDLIDQVEIPQAQTPQDNRSMAGKFAPDAFADAIDQVTIPSQPAQPPNRIRPVDNRVLFTEPTVASHQARMGEGPVSGTIKAFGTVQRGLGKIEDIISGQLEEAEGPVSQAVVGGARTAGSTMGAAGAGTAAIAEDIMEAPAQIAGYQSPFRNIRSLGRVKSVGNLLGGLEQEQPTPFEEETAQTAGVPRFARMAATGLAKMEPQLAAGFTLSRLGVAPNIAAALPMAVTEKGEIDPIGATIAYGLPGAQHVGEQAVAMALSEVPVSKVVIDTLKRDPLKLKGKITQSLGGISFSNDQFRRFLEQGGGYLMSNAYLAAVEAAKNIEEVANMSPEQRTQWILDIAAQNLAPSVLGFLHGGESRTVTELRPFMRKGMRPPIEEAATFIQNTNEQITQHQELLDALKTAHGQAIMAGDTARAAGIEARLTQEENAAASMIARAKYASDQYTPDEWALWRAQQEQPGGPGPRPAQAPPKQLGPPTTPTEGKPNANIQPSPVGETAETETGNIPPVPGGKPGPVQEPPQAPPPEAPKAPAGGPGPVIPPSPPTPQPPAPSLKFRDIHNDLMAGGTATPDEAVRDFLSYNQAWNEWMGRIGPVVRAGGDDKALRDEADERFLTDSGTPETGWNTALNLGYKWNIDTKRFEKPGTKPAAPPPTAPIPPSLEEVHKGVPPVPKGQTPVRIQKPDGTVIAGTFNGYWGPGQPAIAIVKPSGAEGTPMWSHGMLAPGDKILEKIPTFNEWHGSQPAMISAQDKVTISVIKGMIREADEMGLKIEGYKSAVKTYEKKGVTNKEMAEWPPINETLQAINLTIAKAKRAQEEELKNKVMGPPAGAPREEVIKIMQNRLVEMAKSLKPGTGMHVTGTWFDGGINYPNPGDAYIKSGRHGITVYAKYDDLIRGTPSFQVEEPKLLTQPNDEQLRGIILSNDNGQQKAASLRKLATQRNLSIKEIQEQVELELVQMAHETALNPDWNPHEKFLHLISVYNLQPTLSARTSISVRNQAYSTPMPMAFALGHMTLIDPSTALFDDTAGNGMLFIGGDLANSEANELDPERVKNLKALGIGTVTQNDATKVIPARRFKLVHLNPPFGKMDNVSFQGYGFKKLEYLITAKALEAMGPDGTAGIILGAGMEPNAGRENKGALWVFENWLYAHYNVVANFEVTGDLYAKQGAKWPIQVIIVAGRKANPVSVAESADLGPKSVARLENWEDVWKEAERTRNAVIAIRATLVPGGKTGVPDLLPPGGGPPRRTGRTSSPSRCASCRD